MQTLEKELKYLKLRYDSSTSQCLQRYSKFVELQSEKELQTELGITDFWLYMSELLKNGNGSNGVKKDPKGIHEELTEKYTIYPHITTMSGEPVITHEGKPRTLEQIFKINGKRISEKAINEFTKRLKEKAELAASIGDYDQIRALAEQYQTVLFDFNRIPTQIKIIKPGWIGRKILGRKNITEELKNISDEDKKYFSDLEEKAKESKKAHDESREMTFLINEYGEYGGDLETYVKNITAIRPSIDISDLTNQLKTKRVSGLKSELNPYITFQVQTYELMDLERIKKIAAQTKVLIEQNGKNPLILSLTQEIPIAMMNVCLGIYRNETLTQECRKKHLAKAQISLLESAEEFARKKDLQASLQFIDLYGQLSNLHLEELEETPETIAEDIEEVIKIFNE
jgi:hypothetical protein